MVNRETLSKRPTLVTNQREVADRAVHPSWLAFIRYCSDLQHGEIEILKIQDGLPVIAEIVRKKIKFTP
jgi:hypothetical protein